MKKEKNRSLLSFSLSLFFSPRRQSPGSQPRPPRRTQQRLRKRRKGKRPKRERGKSLPERLLRRWRRGRSRRRRRPRPAICALPGPSPRQEKEEEWPWRGQERREGPLSCRRRGVEVNGKREGKKEEGTKGEMIDVVFHNFLSLSSSEQGEKKKKKLHVCSLPSQPCSPRAHASPCSRGRAAAPP